MMGGYAPQSGEEPGLGRLAPRTRAALGVLPPAPVYSFLSSNLCLFMP